MKLSTKNITLAAFFLALGLVMPFITMQIPSIGSMLLPMHIPVLLCGFVLGPSYGLLVGFITPLLRSMIFGMPYMFPTAFCMAFELAAYGCFTGFFYRLLKKNTLSIYLSLLLSMILGRIVWGVVSLAVYGFQGASFTLPMFIAGSFTNALPGIILQIILIPLLVLALKKGRLIND